MKITFRSLHRGLGYFYIGLIIAFAVSGIFMNHRAIWYPLKYQCNSYSIQISKSLIAKGVNKKMIHQITKELNINDVLRGFNIEDGTLWISYKDVEVAIDASTGKGKFSITPILGHMTKLHVSTNKFWIYYSDVFALSLLVITISSMFFPKGKYSFKEYGWKLTVAGLIFPLLFLIFLS
jgi:uncharacterized protein